MSAKANKKIIEGYSEALWNGHDASVLEEVFTDKTVIHSPFRRAQGREEMQALVEHWLEIFPDIVFYWDTFIAEGDYVVVRWHAVGTHMGDLFETTPTHQEVCFSGVHTYLFEKSRIAEFWSLVDIHGINIQLRQQHIEPIEAD